MIFYENREKTFFFLPILKKNCIFALDLLFLYEKILYYIVFPIRLVVGYCRCSSARSRAENSQFGI